MKKSEFIAKLNELFGEEHDVEIYLRVNDIFLEDNFNIFISDGDAVIEEA